MTGHQGNHQGNHLGNPQFRTIALVNHQLNDRNPMEITKIMKMIQLVNHQGKDRNSNWVIPWVILKTDHCPG